MNYAGYTTKSGAQRWAQKGRNPGSFLWAHALRDASPLTEAEVEAAHRLAWMEENFSGLLLTGSVKGFTSA